MKEYTYSNGQADIMIKRGEQGEILDIYTYKNDVSNINIEGSWHWVDGKNPLFVHLHGKEVAFYTALQLSGHFTCIAPD